MFRLPYYGNDPSKYDTEGLPVLEAQRLGYVVSIHDFDSDDWKYGEPGTRPDGPIPLPPATADNLTVLLHDAGGDRTATLDYLRRLIPWARQNGFTFQSIPQVSTEVRSRTASQAPDLWDRETLWSYQLRWVVPSGLLGLLFWVAVVFVVLGGILNVLLAVGRALAVRRKSSPGQSERGPPVTAVLAAFNESAVIAGCLNALCGSRYRRLVEIIVVDDGSTDDTAAVVEAKAAGDRRIRLLRQPNRGKAKALNRAFAEARTDVVVTLDADTVFAPHTIEHLVQGFARDPGHRLGAVAGNVKVGNIGNVWTRWQALEYIMQIGVDRCAQELLRAIVVVPGACAAWRRTRVLSVGGFSSDTLAEDCDLALKLQKRGYRVAQCVWAESSTEAPETLRELGRQRYRWTFGNMQALWKHRSMMLNPRYGWLGLFSLPVAALSLVMPLVFLPFVYAMAAVALTQQRGFVLLIYGAIILFVQLLQALAGVVLTRERPAHLVIVPIYRLIAEPLRAYLVYRSALAVLQGTRSEWNKVTRRGTVDARATGRGTAVSVTAAMLRLAASVLLVTALTACTGSSVGPDTGPPSLHVAGYVVPWDRRSDPAVGARVLDEVSPVWFQPTESGTVEYASEQARASDANFGAAGLPVMPSISNFRGGAWDGELVAGLVSDPQRRSAHVAAIVALVHSHGWSGVDIDYESLPASSRTDFSAFLTELAHALHAVPARLSVTVHAKTVEPGGWPGAQAQDWHAIGAAADEVRVMAYDYSHSASPPGPIAPPSWVDMVLTLAAKSVPLDKITLGLATYGYDWIDDANGTPMQWVDVQAVAQTRGAPLEWDDHTSSPWLRYTDEQGRGHTVWYEDARSLDAKLDIARHHNVRRVVLWRLGGEDPSVWAVLHAAR